MWCGALQACYQQLLGGRVADHPEMARLASPIHHISADDPPVLLVYGDQDCVVPPMEAQHMQKALELAGVPVEACVVPGMGHDMRAIWRAQVVDCVGRFFHDNLEGNLTARQKQILPTSQKVQ